MPTVRAVERKIYNVEGFDVVIRHLDGRDVRGDREKVMSVAQNEAQQAFTAKMQAKHITPLWTIANRVTPWWNDAVVRLASAGGRADEWRVPVELPPMLRMFDKAAGLDHRDLTFKTIYLG